MAITYGAAGTIGYSTSNPVAAVPAGIIAGNYLVILIGSKPDTATATDPVGWIDLGSFVSTSVVSTGIDKGPTKIRAYGKTAVGGETAVTVVIAGNSVSWAQMLRFSNATGIWGVAVTNGEDLTAGTAWSATMVSNPGLTAGDMCLVASTIPTDVTTPAQFTAELITATGVSAWGNSVEVSEPDSALGQDIGGFVFYKAVTTGTSTAAPVVTATAGGTTTNVYGPTMLIRLREQSAPTVALNTPADTATITDPTPTLAFTGTDNEANDIEYQVQIDMANTFDSVKTSPTPPSALGGTSLAAWFKADAIVASDGSSLTSWADSSSNANNLTTVTASAPIYRATGGPNSLPYVDHTVAAGGLYSDVSTGMPTGDYTFFAVVQAGSFVGFRSLLNAHGFPSGTAEIRLADLNIEILKSGVVSLKVSTAALAANTWTIILVTFTAIGSSVHFDIGGTIENYNVGGTTAFVQTGINYGNYEQRNSYYDGKTAEIGLYSSVLSSTDLATLKNYLTAKYWGIPLLSKFSVSDPGFLDITNGADTHPFASGDQLGYTVQAGDTLAGGAYYWRVAGTDPLGTNAYGAWATTRSFTVTSGATGIKVWNGTTWGYKPVKVWNGSAWVVKPVKVWNGTAWVIKG